MEAGSCCTYFKNGKTELLLAIIDLSRFLISPKIFNGFLFHFNFSYIQISMVLLNRNLVACLIDVLPSICSQGQFDSVYFDFSQAFDIVSHTLLLDKFNNFGLFYENFFQSYLSNRSSFVRIFGKFSSPCSPLSGVPQGSTLEPLLFKILSTTFLLQLIIPNFS
jgi:hypothetical protein